MIKLEVELMFCLCQRPNFGDTQERACCVYECHLSHVTWNKKVDICTLGQFQKITANSSHTFGLLLSDPQWISYSTNLSQCALKFDIVYNNREIP